MGVVPALSGALVLEADGAVNTPIGALVPAQALCASLRCMFTMSLIYDASISLVFWRDIKKGPD